MRWKRFFLLLFLIPGLTYASFYAADHVTAMQHVTIEWAQHENLIRQFNALEPTTQALRTDILKEAIACCLRAVKHCDYILKQIADKPKHDRRDEYWVQAKSQCNQDKNTLNAEIGNLQALINQTLAFARVVTLHQESEQKVNLANLKNQNCPRYLNNVEEVVFTLNEISKLYEEALTLALEALNTISPYPDENGKDMLGQVIANYQATANEYKQEADDWPSTILSKKSALEQRLTTLKEDRRLFEEKGLQRSSYEVQKQTASILEQLGEAYEEELIQLRHSIATFEKKMDNNRLTEHIPLLSIEDFRAREKERRELFFGNDLLVKPELLLQGMLQSESRPFALALDGQVVQNDKNFTLYTEQFYRFLIQHDVSPSELFVTVYKQGAVVHEEVIALPIKGTASWERYLIADRMTFIPETTLKTGFGLDLRLSFTCDPRCNFSMIIAQKSTSPDYQFSFSLKDKTFLYACNFLPPPPWQLGILRKPAPFSADKFIDKKSFSPIVIPKNESGKQLEECFPVLDQLVDQLKNDPLALAGYVYNEIALDNRLPYQEDGAFHALGIQRNACMTFLEKLGSPWEQCQLLVYLLRKAGYPSLYVSNTQCSLPKAFFENMLFTKLSEGQSDGLVNYPWVVFFDGKEWISLFPWMKEMSIHEGYDLYNLMPEEYASADRWILRYLKGDERILKHINSDDKDDTLGILFVRFVKEELGKQGLSLTDVGIQRTQIKKQFSSWSDFFRPLTRGTPEILDSLNKNSNLFAKVQIEIFSHENPNKKILHTIPLVALNCNAIPLRFTSQGDNHQYLHARLIGEMLESLLDLDDSDQIIDIKVHYENFVGPFLSQAIRTISMAKGTEATLCFHLGGASSKITSQFYQQFSTETEEITRLHALLAFVGAAYFEKCGYTEKILSQLHKTSAVRDFAFGVVKLSSSGSGNGKEDLKTPQIDMMTCISPLGAPPEATFWLQDVYAVFRSLQTLLVVDASSNEHQVLLDVFGVKEAISTVKLLQLANREQQKKGLPEPGFLTLTPSNLDAIETTPEAVKIFYFSQLEDVNFHDIKEASCGQWDFTKKTLNQENDYDIMGNQTESKTFSPSKCLLSATYVGYDLNNAPIWQQTANPNNIFYLDYHVSGLIKASRQTLSPGRSIAYTLYEYDTRGYLIEEVDPLGYTTYRDYDALGKVICETKEGVSTFFTYEPGGLLESITSPSGAKIRRFYTTNGLLHEEIYPDSTKSSIIYDFFGRPVREIKNNIVWEITYDDPHHRVVRTNSATKISEIQEFDARGNLIRFIDATGYTSEKTYDGLNRLKTETSPSGQQTVWDYQGDTVICTLSNGEKKIQQYEGGRVAESKVFDTQGNLIANCSYHYDPETETQEVVQGEVLTTTWMNALERPIKIQTGDVITTYEYDFCGNCTQIVDGDGRTTRQTFDGLKRMTQRELPDGALIYHVYDHDSNLAEYHLPNGTIWKASYDSMGRKIIEELQAGRHFSLCWEYIYENGYLKEAKDPTQRIHAYLYDLNGQLLQEQVDGWQRNFTYDPRGLLVSAEQLGVQSISWLSSWLYSPQQEHSKVERAYDADGHLILETISLNSQIIQQTQQTWDVSSRSLQIDGHTRDFIYQNNQLTQISTNGGDLSYVYDLSGSLKYRSASSCTTTIGYNSSGFLESIHTNLPDDIYQESLDWYPSGKLLAYDAPRQQKDFAYTERGYLHSAGEESYTFDFGTPGIGVRTAAPTRTVSQNGLDVFGKILTEISDQNSLKTIYNPMGEISTQNQRTFAWDPWGHLLQVSDKTFTWEASYDTFGRRLQTRYTPSRSSTLTTTSFYDPEKEFQEIGVHYGDKTFWKIYGPNSCDMILDETGASVVLLHNALAQLIGTMSQQGLLYNEHLPSAYGPQTATAPTPSDLLSYAQALTWHSLSQDPTGLIWMGARYYDPKGGRFLSPDPLSYPICLDLYAYSGGDPINYMDPDGRFRSPIYQPIKATVLKVWNDPHFQGSVQALGGLGEATAGGLAILGSEGVAAPFAWPILAHGLDQFFTGVGTAFSGKPRMTATEQVLHQAGMSSEWASLTNNLLSLGFTMGATGITRNILNSSRSAASTISIASESAYNRAAFERYKIMLRAQMKKPYVIDPQLETLLNLSYRPNASFGNGSTAAAIRHERMTGESIFGKLHSQKGRELINSFESWLKNNPTARSGDRAAAENIIKDLRNSLGE